MDTTDTRQDQVAFSVYLVGSVEFVTPILWIESKTDYITGGKHVGCSCTGWRRSLGGICGI